LAVDPQPGKRLAFARPNGQRRPAPVRYGRSSGHGHGKQPTKAQSYEDTAVHS
jgi:hypothetical protein